MRHGHPQFAEAYGKPIVLYIKFEGYLEPGDAQGLVDDGVVNWINTPSCARIPRRMLIFESWSIVWIRNSSSAALVSNRPSRT